MSTYYVTVRNGDKCLIYYCIYSTVEGKYNMFCTSMCAVISCGGAERVCGLLPNQLSLAWHCVCLCVFEYGSDTCVSTPSPDIRLCLRMASLIRSYVTSSVQLTSAFLVMLGSVPEEARKEQTLIFI